MEESGEVFGFNQFLDALHELLDADGAVIRWFSAAGASMALARMRSYPLMTSPTPWSEDAGIVGCFGMLLAE